MGKAVFATKWLLVVSLCLSLLLGGRVWLIGDVLKRTPDDRASRNRPSAAAKTPAMVPSRRAMTQSWLAVIPGAATPFLAFDCFVPVEWSSMTTTVCAWYDTSHRSHWAVPASWRLRSECFPSPQCFSRWPPDAHWPIALRNSIGFLIVPLLALVSCHLFGQRLIRARCRTRILCCPLAAPHRQTCASVGAA